MRSIIRILSVHLLAAMALLAAIPAVTAQAAQPGSAAPGQRAILDAPGVLEASIALLPLDDPGRFDLTVTDWEGNVVATASQLGDGGATGALSLPPGQYSLSQEASAGTSRGLYMSYIECRDGANLDLVVASCVHCVALSGIPVVGDHGVVCTVNNANAQPPLAATIAQFEATCHGDAPLLTWETAHEIDVLGFNLYRAASPAQPDVQINPDLIPAASPGGPSGASYSWLDQDAPSDVAYAYWLEVFSLDGSTNLMPPVEVTCQAPTAVRLAALEATSPAAGASGLAVLALTLLLLPAVWLRWRSRGA